MEIGANLGVLLLFAGFALFSEPISVAHAGKPPNTPVTCTLTAGYTITTSSTAPDVLIPFAFPSDDCAIVGCTYVLSGRVGDVGDYFAICQGSTPCDAYTTVGVDVDVTSFPYTNEPEIFAFCSNFPTTDAMCFTGSSTKGCNIKEVDCFAGTDEKCSASKKLGGGIKGTFVCLLDLPEPPAPATPGTDTVYITAHCQLS
jgi:hypothetical protein